MEDIERKTYHLSLLWPCSSYTHRKWHSGLHSVWWKYSQPGHTAFDQEPSLLFILVHVTLNTDTTLTLPDLSLHRTHTGALSTQRASYKNIQVSPTLADGCYYGNTVTNRARVWARLHRWAETLQRSVTIKQRKWTWATWFTLLLSCLQHVTNNAHGNKYFTLLVWQKDKLRATKPCFWPCVSMCTLGF